MRDANSQRPVFLIRVAQGSNRVADIEAFSRATASLRSESIPHKVVTASGGDLGDHDVIVIAEEFQKEAFAIALANAQPFVIYLDFARVAYQKNRAGDVTGEVLGEFKAVEKDHGGELYFDANLSQYYAIV